MIVRLYNKALNKFFGKGVWGGQGKVYGRKCDLMNSLSYYNVEKDDKDLEVWVYTELGVTRIPLVTFAVSRRDRVKKPFNVYFVNNKMQRFVDTQAARIYESRGAECVGGTEWFNDTLVYVKPWKVSNGSGALLRGTNGREYFASPTRFAAMIPHATCGVIKGKFRFTSSGGYASVCFIGEDHAV